MSVLVIQNYPGSGLGQIEPILIEAGRSIDLFHAYRGDALPQDDSAYQALIVLGGEQNALADAEFPYFPDLLNLIRTFGDKDKAVLGICLGSQLVARAYGAENILDRPMEFGWREVRLTERGKAIRCLPLRDLLFRFSIGIAIHFHCQKVPFIWHPAT